MLSYLKELNLVDIENLTIEGDDSVTEMFPSIEFLELKKATVSSKGMSSSSSLTTPKNLKLFPCLKVLTIEECDRVNGVPWPMLSTLNCLTIISSKWHCLGVNKLESALISTEAEISNLENSDFNLISQSLLMDHYLI